MTKLLSLLILSCYCPYRLLRVMWVFYLNNAMIEHKKLKWIIILKRPKQKIIKLFMKIESNKILQENRKFMVRNQMLIKRKIKIREIKIHTYLLIQFLWALPNQGYFII